MTRRKTTNAGRRLAVIRDVEKNLEYFLGDDDDDDDNDDDPAAIFIVAVVAVVGGVVKLYRRL